MAGVSLKDIGRKLYTDVKLAEDETVRVRGLSIDDVIFLIDRYPPIERALMDRDIRAGLQTKDIMSLVPEAVAAVMLCGMEAELTEENIGEIRKWPIGHQASVVTGILGRTFQRGFGPFVDELETLGVLTRRSSGDGSKGQGTNSRSQPSSSSSEGTTAPTSSSAPPESSSPGLN